MVSNLSIDWHLYMNRLCKRVEKSIPSNEGLTTIDGFNVSLTNIMSIDGLVMASFKIIKCHPSFVKNNIMGFLSTTDFTIV